MLYCKMKLNNNCVKSCNGVQFVVANPVFTLVIPKY